MHKFPALRVSTLICKAFEHAQKCSFLFLFSYVVRAWRFAIHYGGKSGLLYDPEVVVVAALLHDLGLTLAINNVYRSEINRVNCARHFVAHGSFYGTQCQLVWDAIALRKESEVALTGRGVGTDFGRGTDSFRKAAIDAILRAVPCLHMEDTFKQTSRMIATTCLGENYDNFVAAFGERFGTS